MLNRSLSLLLFGLIALLSLATPTHAGPDFWAMWNNRNRCAQKDARVLAAINAFCNTNFYTGGPYASGGVAVAGVRVGVGATCRWGTFVPQVWCESQMLEVCAMGGGRGRGKRSYDGGCQHFWITNA
ncbi:unnamed protein product [Aureobasidium mustum]|uniref:Uncharacterized protein n=1 Tax=Aureobasidium mustum TaxID=2773714 RepID=A0A9N8PKA8_9PEZI|nr:unnamed protein product [Aureobasidium mustum]